MEKIAISVPEAAKLMSVSKPKMYELIHMEGFPAVKLGGRTLVPLDGLKAWMQSQVEQRGGTA